MHLFSTFLQQVLFSPFNIHTFRRRKARRTQPTSVILCLVILTLFISTTTYLVTVAMKFQYIMASLVVPQTNVNWQTSSEVENSNLEEYANLEYCAGTAALTLNV